MKGSVIPIIIVALGTVLKGLGKKRLVELEMGGKIGIIEIKAVRDRLEYQRVFYETNSSVKE